MPVNSAPPVIYDVTRLVTRALNLSPNGIDRVDFALARHFLSRGAAPMVCTARGPRLSDREKALRTIERIEGYWRESADVAGDAVLAAVVAALRGDNELTHVTRHERRPGFEGIAENWRAIREWAFDLGRPLSDVPRGAIYFNATQFLLDRAWYVRWLETRPDVKLVAFVHDLLPLDRPEFFRPIEARLHPRRHRNVCRLAAGVVVSSHEVETRFNTFAVENRRPHLPVCVAPLPVSRDFEGSVTTPVGLTGMKYFVVCGTIEPRKNHMLLLKVWRELGLRGDTPKLVIVGKRGWLYKDVVNILDSVPLLRRHVIEASGLSTPGLRRLMAGACALLMPSFGEGFGLPVAEALVAGVPVIASDLEVFREIAGNAPDYLDPHDLLGWAQAVREFSKPESRRRVAALARIADSRVSGDPQAFFERIERFMTTLSGPGTRSEA